MTARRRCRREPSGRSRSGNLSGALQATRQCGEGQAPSGQATTEAFARRTAAVRRRTRRVAPVFRHFVDRPRGSARPALLILCPVRPRGSTAGHPHRTINPRRTGAFGSAVGRRLHPSGPRPPRLYVLQPLCYCTARLNAPLLMTKTTRNRHMINKGKCDGSGSRRAAGGADRGAGRRRGGSRAGRGRRPYVRDRRHPRQPSQLQLGCRLQERPLHGPGGRPRLHRRRGFRAHGAVDAGRHADPAAGQEAPHRLPYLLLPGQRLCRLVSRRGPRRRVSRAGSEPGELSQGARGHAGTGQERRRAARSRL